MQPLLRNYFQKTQSEKGFTLIELLVVVVFVSIVLVGAYNVIGGSRTLLNSGKNSEPLLLDGSVEPTFQSSDGQTIFNTRFQDIQGDFRVSWQLKFGTNDRGDKTVTLDVANFLWRSFDSDAMQRTEIQNVIKRVPPDKCVEVYTWGSRNNALRQYPNVVNAKIVNCE